MTSFQYDRAIPAGSLVVVSGVNGFIASHIVDQLLLSGYRVRGTIRNLSKYAWSHDFFNGKYSDGSFELAEVPDMGVPGAFHHVVKGASGFVHVATPVMQSTDPNQAVPTVINEILNTLTAAATNPQLTRVVMTSSSTAATAPKPNVEFSFDEKTWNHEDVEAAWKTPPYEGHSRVLAVCSASKMQSEEAAWKWMKEHRTHFVLNAILPNATIVTVLCPQHQGAPSTVGWLKALWNGFEGQEDLKENPPQYYVNVQDDARVHVAALLSPDVQGERIFAFAHPFNWNDILAIFRKLYPQ